MTTPRSVSYCISIGGLSSYLSTLPDDLGGTEASIRSINSHKNRSSIGTTGNFSSNEIEKEWLENILK